MIPQKLLQWEQFVKSKTNNLQAFEHLLSPGCFPRNGLLAHVMGLLKTYYCLPWYSLAVLHICVLQSRTGFFLLQMCRASGKGRGTVGCRKSNRTRCWCCSKAVWAVPLGTVGEGWGTVAAREQMPRGSPAATHGNGKIKSSIKVKQELFRLGVSGGLEPKVAWVANLESWSQGKKIKLISSFLIWGCSQLFFMQASTSKWEFTSCSWLRIVECWGFFPLK